MALSKWKWYPSSKSIERLSGLHPDLVMLVQYAWKKGNYDFTVIEGLRAVERQRMLFEKGATKTMNSRHLYGLAVDLAPIDPATKKITWSWDVFTPFGKNIKELAKELKIQIEWGGDWKSFKDGPHFQLPANTYPNDVRFMPWPYEEIAKIVDGLMPLGAAAGVTRNQNTGSSFAMATATENKDDFIQQGEWREWVDVVPAEASKTLLGEGWFTIDEDGRRLIFDEGEYTITTVKGKLVVTKKG